MLISVPLLCIEFSVNPIPNLSHSFLHRYNPIPVDLPYNLPFSPVNPFSKTLFKSFGEMPTPLSFIVSIVLFSFLVEYILTLGFSVVQYFIEFDII
ncbi:hypothetical protein SDC9_168611 [bioreactor metagenome]|uniref:Uncharacterized protein n=1 Tax=bioreactor metagenome TaxID=1076179 RepID=A0A645G5J6_9ZZZZ